MADQNSTAVANQSNSETTLTLRSSDGKDFTISVSAAVQSVTLKNMLESTCASGAIPLESIKAGTLEKIIAYLNKQVEEGLSNEDNQKFKDEFFEGLHFLVLAEFLNAANFLEIEDLVDLTCQKMANIMKNKNVTWVRNTLGIENDFTAEEEAEIRKKDEWAYENTEDDDGAVL